MTTSIVVRGIVVKAPCPFCSSLDVELDAAGKCMWVLCRECLAEGPMEPTEERAIARWEHRERDTARAFYAGVVVGVLATLLVAGFAALTRLYGAW